ncbi:MAG: mechanosensitive ion channel family protein [Chromatiales bacterium]|jgi:small-conductance mechanosensitive channel
MTTWIEWLNQLGGTDRVLTVMQALLLLALGYLLARLLSRGVGGLVQRHTTVHQAVLWRRGIYYLVLGAFAVMALREMGFKLTVLLGAAGIVTVALGFASQTSASNLISGLFLLFERPFQVGDVVRVGSTTGEVLSVDLLSVKLRTYDNLYVRIPNETLIKSEVTTLTRFPIRRLDMRIGVAYKEDIGRVREVLEEAAEHEPLCLEEPRPLFIFQGFGDSSLDIQFSVWAQRENFIPLRNSMHIRIKEAFDARGIEIPFPHRSIYAGALTDPFPVQVVSGQPRSDTGTDGPVERPSSSPWR